MWPVSASTSKERASRGDHPLPVAPQEKWFTIIVFQSGPTSITRHRSRCSVKCARSAMMFLVFNSSQPRNVETKTGGNFFAPSALGLHYAVSLRKRYNGTCLRIAILCSSQIKIYLSGGGCATGITQNVLLGAVPYSSCSSILRTPRATSYC